LWKRAGWVRRIPKKKTLHGKGRLLFFERGREGAKEAFRTERDGCKVTEPWGGEGTVDQRRASGPFGRRGASSVGGNWREKARREKGYKKRINLLFLGVLPDGSQGGDEREPIDR